MAEHRSADELITGLIRCAREAADLVRPGDGEFHLKTLLAVRDWAYAQQPHQPGDRVEIAVPLDFVANFGWKLYEKYLQVGSKGTVKSIDFSVHSKRWTATVKMDGLDYGFTFAQSRLIHSHPHHSHVLIGS